MGIQWAIADTRTVEVGIVDARPGGEAKIHAGYAERKACFFLQHVKNFSLGSSGCFDGDFLILDDPQECSHKPAKIVAISL